MVFWKKFVKIKNIKMEERRWKKIISQDEKIEYYFGLGKRYLELIKFLFFFSSFLCFISFSIFYKFSQPVFILIGQIIFFFGVFSLFLAFFAPWYLKKANNFALTNKRILVLKGWLSTQLISIDYNKITDIKVEQNFLEKIILKTGAITINTAGSPEPEGVILNIENPYKIKQELEKIKNKE